VTNETFQMEEEHLSFVVQFLKAYHADLGLKLGNKTEGIRSRREEINDELSHIVVDFDDGNFWEFVTMLPEIRMTEMDFNYIKNMYEMTKSMIPKPYFGKIIVDGDEVYIGNRTIRDNNNDILIYDWRTPIASLFYENTTGHLSYKIPDGQLIEADVSSRRQFIVENSTLMKMFDSDLYIGDEVLQNIITDSSGNKLKNIVATIQQEQNDIIRQPLKEDTLVYGPPGSGKTSLALQRIAFLLYQYKDILKPESILLLSPNEVFNDYLSDVLPELGEKHVKNTTFYRLISEFPYFKGRKFESIYENINRLQDEKHNDYTFKSSLEYFESLHIYLKNLQISGFHFRDVKYQGGILISKESLNRLFYHDLKNHNVSRRLKKIKEYLIEEYQICIKKIEQKKLKSLVDQNTYVGEIHELKQEAHEYAKKKMQSAHRQIMRGRFVHIEKIYAESFTDKVMKNRTIKSIIDNQFKYEDIAPLLYIYIHLFKVSDPSISHVLVDEIQDYSNLQYYVMKHYFNKATFTSLGDLNQKIHPADKDELVIKNHTVKHLKNSYRSTNQINQYLNELIPETIHSVSVDGAPVERMDTSRPFQDLIEILQLNKDRQTAIITPSRESADALYTQLKDAFPEFKNLQEKDTLYHQSFIILPFYLSKGFEYNTVIVYGAEQFENQTHINYVLASRATRHLYLINTHSS
jgi:DNA helicase-2/ATP-dependent DNA helicase PcrA